MINKIKQFFNAHITDSTDNRGKDSDKQIRIAAAALLVETVVTDGLIASEEEAAIISQLGSGFGLSDDETEELFELARNEVAEAVSLFQFTSLINQQFSQEEKFKLLTQAWYVAMADGLIDKYEENLIRRLADLLHVSHSQFIRAKIKARAIN